MTVSPPDLSRGWTLGDLHLLPDDGQRYELVDGGLVVTPPPSQQHQMLADDLRERLQATARAGWRARLEFPIPSTSTRSASRTSSSTAGRSSTRAATSATRWGRATSG